MNNKYTATCILLKYVKVYTAIFENKLIQIENVRINNASFANAGGSDTNVFLTSDGSHFDQHE